MDQIGDLAAEPFAVESLVEAVGECRNFQNMVFEPQCARSEGTRKGSRRQGASKVGFHGAPVTPVWPLHGASVWLAPGPGDIVSPGAGRLC